MRIDVDPGAFSAASSSIGRALATDLEGVYQDLSIELGGCTVMAGGDTGGRRWSDVYDQTGPRAAAALADLDTAARRLGALLQATGFNHARADASSDASRCALPPDSIEYDTSAPSRYGLPGGTGGIVPSAAGGSGQTPGGWGLIKALVGMEWPDGRQDRLHRAARAWRHASRRLAGLTGHIDDAITAVGFQRAPETDDALTACANLRANVLQVADSCARLADACLDLAHHTDEVHASAKHALQWLLALSAATQVAGAVVSIFTFGLAEGPTQVIEAGELQAVASEVEAYLVTFVNNSTEVALLVSRVDSEVLAVSRSLAPILAADIRIADAELVPALPSGAIASVEEHAVTNLIDAADRFAAGRAGAAKVPRAWGPGRANSKGVGIRWEDPAYQGNGIRIDRGNPSAHWPSQRVDHVVVRSGGKIIGVDGEPIVGSLQQNPSAHIPLSVWLTWTRWDHP